MGLGMWTCKTFRSIGPEFFDYGPGALYFRKVRGDGLCLLIGLPTEDKTYYINLNLTDNPKTFVDGKGRGHWSWNKNKQKPTLMGSIDSPYFHGHLREGVLVKA